MGFYFLCVCRVNLETLLSCWQQSYEFLSSTLLFMSVSSLVSHVKERATFRLLQFSSYYKKEKTKQAEKCCLTIMKICTAFWAWTCFSDTYTSPHKTITNISWKMYFLIWNLTLIHLKCILDLLLFYCQFARSASLSGSGIHKYACFFILFKGFYF